MALDDWSEKQVEVAGDLGYKEIEKRVAVLSDYYKFDTVATIYDSRALTPVQAMAWAKFAQTLGNDYLLDGSSIKRAKSEEDIALIVVTQEITRRDKERKARIAELRTQRDEGNDFGEDEADELTRLEVEDE